MEWVIVEKEKTRVRNHDIMSEYIDCRDQLSRILCFIGGRNFRSCCRIPYHPFFTFRRYVIRKLRLPPPSLAVFKKQDIPCSGQFRV